MSIEALLLGELSALPEFLPAVMAGITRGAARPLAVVSTDVRIFEGANALSEAAPFWQALEAEAAAKTPFQILAVAEAANALHVARGDYVRVAVSFDKGRPMALLATATASVYGLPITRFLGDPLIQYGDALAVQDAPQHHIESVYAAVASAPNSGLTLLRKVRSDAALAAVLGQFAVQQQAEAAPFIDLRKGAEGIVQSRRDLARKRKKLAANGDVAFEILSGPALEAALTEALAMKSAWLEERGLASPVIGHAAWHQALLNLAGHVSSPLRAARLSVGGKTAALEIGFVSETHWYAFLGATAPEFAKAGPGHIQMVDLITQLSASGFSTYDLLAPAQPYKTAMTDQAAAVADYADARDALGQVALASVQLKPVVKEALARAPMAIKQRVASNLGVSS